MAEVPKAPSRLKAALPLLALPVCILAVIAANYEGIGASSSSPILHFSALLIAAGSAASLAGAVGPAGSLTSLFAAIYLLQREGATPSFVGPALCGFALAGLWLFLRPIRASGWHWPLLIPALGLAFVAWKWQMLSPPAWQLRAYCVLGLLCIATLIVVRNAHPWLDWGACVFLISATGLLAIRWRLATGIPPWAETAIQALYWTSAVVVAVGLRFSMADRDPPSPAPSTEKVVRIAHISDLHFPTVDQDAAEALCRILESQKPDFLVVTGDLVNHPGMAVRKAHAWIADVARRCNLDMARRVLILSGNHDIFFSGLGGLGPLATIFFNAFHGVPPYPVLYYPGCEVAFFLLDLNPLAAFVTAEGTVSQRAIASLQDALHRHPSRNAIAHATKILLVHHHVLPVPFGGADFLLATRKTQHLLRFIAEQNIGIVLHGHKHNATWSQLRIGADSSQQHFVEILGAGSAMKDASDIDSRGHNFNLVAVSHSGTRGIRQFFRNKRDVTDLAFREAPPSPAESAVTDLILRDHAARYRFGHIQWSVRIDQEGYAENDYALEQIVFNRTDGDVAIRIPNSTVSRGEASGYLLGTCTSHGIGLDGTGLLTFSRTPTRQDPAKAVIRNFEQDSYVLSASEQRERQPSDEGTPRDYLEYSLTEYTAKLTLQLQFDRSFMPPNVDVEVLELGTRAVNDALTVQAKDCLHPFENGAIHFEMEAPSIHYTYRLFWTLPVGAPVPAPAKARRSLLEQVLRESGVNQIVLGKFIMIVAQQLARTMDMKIEPTDVTQVFHSVQEIDAGIFVRSEQDESILRLASHGLNVKNPKFTLPVGSGNGGRAFQSRTVRTFDIARLATNREINTYVPDPAGNQHQFLLSVPILDITNLPICVCSMGALTTGAADLLRPAAEPDVRKAIAAAAQLAILPELLKAANLKAKDDAA